MDSNKSNPTILDWLIVAAMIMGFNVIVWNYLGHLAYNKGAELYHEYKEDITEEVAKQKWQSLLNNER